MASPLQHIAMIIDEHEAPLREHHENNLDQCQSKPNNNTNNNKGLAQVKTNVGYTLFSS